MLSLPLTLRAKQLASVTAFLVFEAAVTSDLPRSAA